MARKIEEIQKDYGQAAAQLGDLTFKRKLSEDEIERIEYDMRKLQNNMESLANEAKKLAEAEAQPQVALPKEPQDEQKNS